MHLDGHQPHILAMDESIELLAFFVELLEEEGYAVSTRSSVTYDLDEIVSVRPDLIILDYLWFSHDDGWAPLRTLRMDTRIRTVPIILCTGASRQLEPFSVRLSELDIQVVFKPFDIEDLLQAVESSVGSDTAPNLNLYPYTTFALQ